MLLGACEQGTFYSVILLIISSFAEICWNFIISNLCLSCFVNFARKVLLWFLSFFFWPLFLPFLSFAPGISTVDRRNFFEIIDISCMISHLCSFTYENRENCLSFVLSSYIEFYGNCLNAVWCSFFLLQCLIQLYFKSPFIDIRFVLFYECPFCLDRGSVFLNLIKIINQTCFKNSLFFVE